MSDEITSIIDLDTDTDPIYIIKNSIMYEGYIVSWSRNDEYNYLNLTFNIMIRRD